MPSPLTLLPLWLGLSFAPLAASTLTIPASLDSTIYSESSPANASNGAGQHFFAGSTARGDLRRGLVWFDVSTVPAGATITAATLSLTVTKAAGGGSSPQAVSLHRALARWGEGTSDAASNEGIGAPGTAGDATWAFSILQPGGASTPWSHSGGDFGPILESILVGGTGTYQWPGSAGLIEAVQSWVDAPDTNFGLFVLGTESTSFTARRFASSENPDPAARPRLTLEYAAIPEPASSLLVLAGALCVFRRRA